MMMSQGAIDLLQTITLLLLTIASLGNSVKIGYIRGRLDCVERKLDDLSAKDDAARRLMHGIAGSRPGRGGAR